MKIQKLKLGLVALILGFGLVITQSAFTPKFDTLYVKLPSGVFVDEASAGGECITDPGKTCKYTLAPGSDPANPANYSESPAHFNQRWIP